MAANKAKEANRAQVLSQRRFETVQEQVEAARSKQAAGRQLLDRQAAEVAELKRSLAEADVAAESFRKQLESLRQQELAARRL